MNIGCSPISCITSGRVVSRTEIIEHLYDQDFDRDSNTIEVFVGRLRKKLGVDLIQTVRGMGYMAPRRRRMDAGSGSRAHAPPRSRHSLHRRAAVSHGGGVEFGGAAGRVSCFLRHITGATAEEVFEQRLDVYLRAIVADVSQSGQEGRTGPGQLGDPQFELALLGLVLADHASRRRCA